MPADQPILIAYDGTAEAGRAIEFAGRLFHGARALVLHVQVPEQPPLAASAGVAMPPPAADRERGARLAREGCEIATEHGLDPEPVVVDDAHIHGLAALVCEIGDANDVAVIVVGTHGRSRLLAALLGSVSDAVVHRSERPVLVVPPTGRR